MSRKKSNYTFVEEYRKLEREYDKVYKDDVLKSTNYISWLNTIVRISSEQRALYASLTEEEQKILRQSK